MKYNFDEIIERFGTNSVKWDSIKSVRGHDDLLPLWIADMDFRTPPFVMEALRKRLEHEVLGYTFVGEEWYVSICYWLNHRYDWKVTRKMLTFVPGIVRGLAFALQCFTELNDRVMVMTPVFHPFFHVSERLGRKVICSPLELEAGNYQINFDRFCKDIQGCKVLILCNPHNPGGRVWTVDELQRIAKICKNNHTFVISDEIHADLTLPPYKHHPFATVSESAARNSLTFMSPSKAFNMPGLSSAYAVLPDEDACFRFQKFMETGEFNEGHLLAYIGTTAAYMHGEEWLEQLLNYINGNIAFTENYLREHVPGIGMICPQASFLIYLDCRALNLSQQKLVQLFVDRAHLALDDGLLFGEPGRGFMRLNIGCPHSTLKLALERLMIATTTKKISTTNE